ncbi:hypothetical protein D3C84_815240 [compost metagenome]
MLPLKLGGEIGDLARQGLMLIELHLLIMADRRLCRAVALLTLITSQGVGDSSGGGQIDGGGDLVKAASGDPARILDDFLQRPDLPLGGACSDLHTANSLGQDLIGFYADPFHFGDVGQERLIISLQLGFDTRYAFT